MAEPDQAKPEITADHILKMLGVEEPPKVPAPNIPGGQTPVGAYQFPSDDLIKRSQNLLRELKGEDEGVDYSGIQDMGFRAELSKRDTDEERRTFLNETLGEENWGFDTYGKYVIHPKGLVNLGIQSDKTKSIEEVDPFTLGDVADMRGDAPAIAGAVIGSALTGGAGIIPALIATSGTAMAFKSVDEILDQIRGENSQSFPEVAGDVAIEGALAATGEVGYRAMVAPFGRRALGPEAHRMTDELRELVTEMEEIGAKIAPSNVTDAPLLGRFQGMLDKIFGDPLAAKNARVFKQEMARLKDEAGPLTEGQDPGELIRTDLSDAREALRSWAKRAAEDIDSFVNERVKGMNVPVPGDWRIIAGPQNIQGHWTIVPTQGLKEAASELVGGLPKSVKTGEPIFVDPATVSTINKIIGELPDMVTISQMQRVTDKLWDAVNDKTIIPGIGSRDAMTLWRSAVDSYDNIADPAIKVLVNSFRTNYKNKIGAFKSSIVQRIMKDPSVAGSLPPEIIIQTLFRKGVHSPMKAVMKHLTPETKSVVRRQAMDDILGSAVARTDDPLVDVFSGKNFLNTLDKYGKGVLEATFGGSLVKDMYKFGRVLQFTTKRMAFSGGIVAANIALHPIQNLGKLIQLRIISKLMQTKGAFYWMTEGIKAPNTRRGASFLARVATQVAILKDDELRKQNDSPNPNVQPDNRFNNIINTI